MKIAKLVAQKRHTRLSPLKAKVLQHLEAHPHEVFPYRDPTLAKALEVKPSALSFTLWALHRDGLIGKETVEGRLYFGALKAIEELRRQLRPGARRVVSSRATALQKRIRARGGNIPVVELLDAVRGPWQ